MKAKLEALITQYGATALVVYLSTSLVTFVGAIVAIQSGFQVEGAAEGAGLFAAAWVVVKLTQPIRVPFTLVATPFVARAWQRLRGRAPSKSSGD